MGETIQIGSEVSLSGPSPREFGPRTEVAVDDTSTSVVPENLNRTGLLFHNIKSGEDCWVALEGEDPVAEEDLKVKKDSTFFVDDSLPITGEIKAICKNAKNTTIIYQEATSL